VNNNYKNNVVNVGTGTPYIITGTGITADFLYPIVSIEHSIPNTNNEAITYINNSGYERLLDS
jgi:putative ABC transport system permease protein